MNASENPSSSTSDGRAVGRHPGRPRFARYLVQVRGARKPPANSAELHASRYVSRASCRSSGSSVLAARRSSAGAALPRLSEYDASARSRSSRARWSSSSGPISAAASIPRAASNAPARTPKSAAASARSVRRFGSRVSATARWRNAAAAASPPRACARPAECSSSRPRLRRARLPPAPDATLGDPRRPPRRSPSPGRGARSAGRPATPPDRPPIARADGGIGPGLRSRAGPHPRRRHCARLDSEPLGGAPEKRRVAHRIRGRQQHQLLRRSRQFTNAPQVVVLDMARDISGGDELEATRQLRGADAPRQLEQSERIAAGLGDDPVADAHVEQARHGARQQGTGFLLASPSSRNSGRSSNSGVRAGSRTAKTTATDSASSRRATNPST